MMEQAAEAKGITIDVALEAAAVSVTADADRLQQVVWNLLSNAVKFTPRGGRVEVRAERRGDRVAVLVRDSGEGIEPAFLPHVFERFRQADSSMSRPHGGLGLGLSIVWYLVDRHGGAVEVESPGPGQGATFTVTLPVEESGSLEAASPIPSAARRSLRGLRVLLVEDDPDSLEVIGAILRDHGARVAVASRAGEALDILGREPVDLLVSDIGLPGADGYELLRRARLSYERIPALALTAYAKADDVQRAELAGFERHIAKPFDPERLVQALTDLAREARRPERPS
jgi:CheY-like chemotaxis protein